MQKSFDLICIDKAWVDVLLRLPALPQHDQKMLGELLGRHPGGVGGNIACAASQLGLHTGMVSWVGDDVDGQLILHDLRRFGVDTTHVKIEPGTITNYTLILIDASGEKSIIIVPTAFNELLLDPLLTAYLNDTKIVYTAPYDPDQLVKVARIVHAAGGLVATDIETVAALNDDALAHVLASVDLAFVHAATLQERDLAQAGRELQALGPELLVITAGAKGALACTANQIVHCPAFEVPVVDTTGAGDCFMGAFLTAYLRQLTILDMLRYAQAAAALSIQAYGARGALPTHMQIEAFLAEHGVR